VWEGRTGHCSPYPDSVSADQRYPMAALERTMKIQEVILRAMAKSITWWQAAEIIGITDRQMRRWHGRYREHGYDGLLA
jgi:Homeodomain-like domain